MPLSGFLVTLHHRFHWQRLDASPLPGAAEGLESGLDNAARRLSSLDQSLARIEFGGLEVRSDLLAVLDVEHTPVMRTWNIVRLQSKLMSPAAEAFHSFVIERGEAYLRAHDTPVLAGLGGTR